MASAQTRHVSPDVWPLSIGIWAALVAALPHGLAQLCAAIALPAVAIGVWTVATPERCVTILFFTLVLTPPLLPNLGNSGVHIAPLAAIPSLFVGAIRISEWRPARGYVPLFMIVFLMVIAGSASLALLYSGIDVAAGSLLRVCLLAISVWLYLYGVIGPRSPTADSFIQLKHLYTFAALAALFACIDFYWQLPAVAGFAPQYIWMDNGVFRRAQGLFYEASTMGNFCACFLVMILVAAFHKHGKGPVGTWLLVAGGFLFTAAMVLSYSRASLGNLAAAGVTFIVLRRPHVRRLPAIFIAISAAGLMIYLTFPAFLSHFFTRLAISIQFFWSNPDRILSGRLESWMQAINFLQNHPLQSLFGIGYKTLPYSTYAGDNLIVDNTYLSLLVETGVAGLGAFIILNAAMLRAGWSAARSTNPKASFFGTWFSCFWIGEMTQMLTGDLITYWRVLPIYFWILAIAVREAST